MSSQYHFFSQQRPEEIRNQLLERIHSGETSSHLDWIRDKNGKFYSTRHLVEMALSNQEIHDFFEKDYELNIFWQECLADKGYLDFVFYRVNAEDCFSIFTQYKGTYYWGSYYQIEDKTSAAAKMFLDKACECNIYDAWVEKIFLLRNQYLSQENLHAMSELTDTVICFADIFWSAGYLFAGTILLEMATWLKAFNITTSWQEILRASAKYLYIGMYLSDNFHSVRLIDRIFAGEGWKRLFGSYIDEPIEFSPEAIEEYFIKLIQKQFYGYGMKAMLEDERDKAAVIAEEIQNNAPSIFPLIPDFVPSRSLSF